MSLRERAYNVLAGDLNTSSRAHLEVADEILAWRGMMRVPGIGRTMKYLFGAGRLDHIFTSAGLEVVASGNGDGFFDTGSDHRPVWAEAGTVARHETGMGDVPGRGTSL